jgi:hypothetical protein
MKCPEMTSPVKAISVNPTSVRKSLSLFDSQHIFVFQDLCGDKAVNHLPLPDNAVRQAIDSEAIFLEWLRESERLNKALRGGARAQPGGGLLSFHSGRRRPSGLFRPNVRRRCCP